MVRVYKYGIGIKSKKIVLRGKCMELASVTFNSMGKGKLKIGELVLEEDKIIVYTAKPAIRLFDANNLREVKAFEDLRHITYVKGGIFRSPTIDIFLKPEVYSSIMKKYKEQLGAFSFLIQENNEQKIFYLCHRSPSEISQKFVERVLQQMNERTGVSKASETTSSLAKDSKATTQLPPKPKFCPKCGFELSPTAKFCKRCGSPAEG